MTTLQRLAITAFCLVCCRSNLARSDPDVSGVNYICNPDTYSDDSLYAFNVEEALYAIPYNTATQGFNYYTVSSNDLAKCYAHGACNGEISYNDCYICLETAVYQIMNQYCPLRIGGHLQLVDCRIRYENYPFKE
ncbi:antifungal protein ginkbilobin-like protein [Eucalyptus grandis]|uniref:Gnk2-homologous domain-containing protein n=1 Tax=Eucalyptus globulus TaxID=34317 RepID=A0ABD3K772_EUCGL|nr:antifungal protein ginkbilobin-like protein [Eucalyptus grandis]